MTQLGLFTEERGKEATGFWGVEAAEPGKIISYKEPIPATEFVKRPIWAKLGALNTNICIVHCRQPTKFGDAKNNSNNHPHLSSDSCTALVHNGNITEYTSLSSDYATESSCDSEIILRIFENAIPQDYKTIIKNKEVENVDLAVKLQGIKDIFAKINHGAMAVAIGERIGTTRRLWLLRNDQRPLHIVNFEKVLGQYFFFSTPKILHQALEAIPKLKALISDDMEIMEITPNTFCIIETDETGRLDASAYTIVKSSSKEWVKEETTKTKIKKPDQKPPVEIITDEIPKPPATIYNQPNTNYQSRANVGQHRSNHVLTNENSGSSDDDTVVLNDFDKKEAYEKACLIEDKIKKMLDDLTALASNKTATENDYNNLIGSVDELSSDIRSMEKMIAS